MIDPTRKSIADIFKLQQRLRVPSYQRDFKWGMDEARDLITDLKSIAENNERQDLFLGNIIVNVDVPNNELLVVDGQQRLTTFAILLLACKSRAKKINTHPHQADAIQRMLTFVKDSTGLSLGARIITSPSIKNLFEYITRSAWEGDFPSTIDSKGVIRQVNRVKPIYDYFLSEINNFDFNQLTKFLEAIYNCYVIYIEIDKQEEAFEIFERTNARGVELDAADLIKNFLFQLQHSSGIGQELEEAWADIVENAKGTILRMLKYFWVAEHGYIQKKQLYPSLRQHGTQIGAKNLLAELVKFSTFYSTVRSCEEEEIKSLARDRSFILINQSQEYVENLTEVLQSLSLFKVTQPYPIIYSSLESYEKSDGANNKQITKKLIELFKSIEKYHFINNVVCERVGNEVERLYADYSPILFASHNFNEAADKLIDELKKRLAGPDEFIPRFADLRYSTADIPLICYIFDRINNFKLKSGQHVKLFYPDRDYIRKNFDIEHFFPQNPKVEDKLPAIGEVVQNIGNLLVISKFTNRFLLKNLSPKDKAEKLSDNMQQIQNLTHIRDFLSQYKPETNTWNEITIKQRALDLAHKAYYEVWSF